MNLITSIAVVIAIVSSIDNVIANTTDIKIANTTEPAGRQRSSIPLSGGKRAPCPIEDAAVLLDIIDTDCVKCFCKHGYVECGKKICPSVEGCQSMTKKTKLNCCDRCQGCTVNGVSYQSHTEWTDPQDPCLVHHCESATITTFRKQCYNSACRNPLPPKAGECCSTCPECEINGRNVSGGRSVSIPEDPCLKCYCSKDKQLICEKKTCPLLMCSPDNQSKRKGDCCPKCKESRTSFVVPNMCIAIDRVIMSGVSFSPDKCTKCTCLGNTNVCERTSCPVLDCKPELQKSNNETCCPYCDVIKEPSRSVCVTLTGLLYIVIIILIHI